MWSVSCIESRNLERCQAMKGIQVKLLSFRLYNLIIHNLYTSNRLLPTHFIPTSHYIHFTAPTIFFSSNFMFYSMMTLYIEVFEIFGCLYLFPANYMHSFIRRLFWWKLKQKSLDSSCVFSKYRTIRVNIINDNYENRWK